MTFPTNWSRRCWVSVALLAIACIAYSVFVMSTLALAEDGEPSTETKAAAQMSAKKKAKGGKGTREKDTDGTEAPHQFEANTVIKSQYKYNGQSLEVDPD
ncbi:MAG: hypothetical protein ACJ763_18610 [Bdellovibrionia bacterium]